jgi:hypothetical protein
MDLDWDTSGSKLPVLFLDHFSVHLLVLVKQLIQVDIRVSVLKLLFLFTISLLLLMNLNKSLLDKFNIRLDQLDDMFESIVSNLMDLRFSASNAGAEWFIGLETLNDG